MGKCRVARASRALLPVVVVLCLSTCRQPVDSAPEAPADVSRNSAAPSGHGSEFLGPAECASRGQVFREVPCGSERAGSRVLARHTGVPSDGPACPPPTDFVLHISPGGAAPSASPAAAPRGYACMRNLESPHPGDPGQGGGPLTVVGDCVHGFREGEVRETACDGSGERPPEFEIGSAVARRGLCPGTTDLYVRLGGDMPVGCAHRM
ncbi:hypothetical protein C5F59_025020 [Streptomyces sp. QL37]|uniref:hypothetical protein n=1 Tax=Streptomyces sp. QL37 TaxID=2093747 RepID=UPI000CF21DBC|nr:hypothetical protein [Streptomyces sp. QL37]PPQ57577.1 hypothetical protein C5F59_13395 [Streptomyces sp. QL37]